MAELTRDEEGYLMLTHDVTFWSIRTNADRRKSHEVRWTTASKAHSRSFITKALAEGFRSDLLQAAKRGEAFDVTSGLPSSMLNAQEPEVEVKGLTWFDFACKYVSDRWPDDAAKTREMVVDGLTTATLALVTGEAARLDPLDVRAAMRWALIPNHRDTPPPDDLEDVLRIMQKDTLGMAELATSEVSRNLRSVLGRKLDGKPAAAETRKGRRKVTYTALEYAVEAGELSENPLHSVGGKRVKDRRVSSYHAVDRRVVANPRQVRELLTCVGYVGLWGRARGRRLVAFFATMYYAALRPSEAIGLRKDDCHLPESGWGTLTIAETRPSSAKQFTDSGEAHDRRGLKQREVGDVREVPIPPRLVSMLRAHIATFGVAADGRLFSTEKGTPLARSDYGKVWKHARELAFTPEQVRSPLASKPYDLRHAALSTWLNGGVDPTEVADRAGNSVEVLFKRYAKCLDDRRDRNNKLIEQALGLDDQ